MLREGLPADLPRDLQGGRFHVSSLLARGSQGMTLVAEDRERGGRVAIKRFQVHGAPSWKQVELAQREAEVLSALSHPNLPKYVTHFEEGGALYLVMELVEGKTLAELKREGALSQRDVLEFMTSVAETLHYLHDRAPPIIHRDVKPGNVIRRPDGSFVLVDFGSVRDKLRPEGGSTVVGTFGYMAPEQFQGRALPVTDTYGLGATAIACLSGEEPDRLPHRGLAIDVRGALAGRADPRLIDLLERMLEPDPERRPSDLRSAVAALTAQRPAPSTREPARAASRNEPATPRETRAPFKLSSVLLPLFLVLAVVFAARERLLLPLVIGLLLIGLLLEKRWRAHAAKRGRKRVEAEPEPGVAEAAADADDELDELVERELRNAERRGPH